MKDLLLSPDELDLIRKKIVRSIADFVQDTGAKGAVFGLSGGVDSALVGVLAKEALKNRVEALVMPDSNVSKTEDLEHAALLSERFEIASRVIDLKETVESVNKALPEMTLDKGDEGFHARANIAPRLRMLFNYAAANLNNYVVLGTGNRTELLLGYFTKNGDGGVDFLPIGSLYKTHVRQLAKHMKIPSEIIDKPPSAGLWHGQTDEAELGETYEILDQILFYIYDKKISANETAEILCIETERVERIIAMSVRHSHKREVPTIVKLPE